MIEQYLQELTPNTSRTYERALRRYFAGNDVVSRRLVVLFRDEVAREVGAATANVWLAAVKGYTRWACDRELLPESAAAALTVGGVKAPPAPVVEPVEDLTEILCRFDTATREGARAVAVLRLLADTGLRVSELVSLNWEDVRWATHQLRVTGKGQKEALVLFSSAVAGALHHMCAVWQIAPERGPVFLNQRGGRLTVRAVQMMCEQVGVHPHQLRHTFATRVLDATGDLDATRRLMRHASVTTTKRYTETATRRLRATYARVFEEQRDDDTTVSYAVRRSKVQVSR